MLLGAGVIIALYGIITFGYRFYGNYVSILPDRFFTYLGYSDLHSLYVPGGPLAAFQQIGGSSIRRIQSTMSGPNQLGLWLLIPWSVGVASIVRRRVFSFWFVVCSVIVIAIAMLLTFSRSAWIGAFVITVIACGSVLPKRVFWTAAGAASALVAIVAIAISLLMPQVFLRIASSRDHYLRPVEAIRTIIAHPLGLGLGSAGPASNRVSDACVMLDAGSDASWAKDRPDLCVFVGETKVQPMDRDCNCPFIPENWYLQIGVELGVIGFILYVLLIVLVLRKLRKADYELQNSVIRNPQFVFLFFVGISMAALFLHAWEDAAVAYTAWILIAVLLRSVPGHMRHHLGN